MYRLHEIQESWKDGILWVEEHLQKGVSEAEKQAFRDASNLLGRIRWDEHTNVPGADGNST